MHAHTIAYVEVTGELPGVSYLFLQCGFQKSNSGLQVLQQAPLPTKLFHHLFTFLWFRTSSTRLTSNLLYNVTAVLLTSWSFCLYPPITGVWCHAELMQCLAVEFMLGKHYSIWATVLACLSFKCWAEKHLFWCPNQLSISCWLIRSTLSLMQHL